MKRLLILLLFCSLASGANDFTGDADFIAYYPNEAADFSGANILDNINGYNCTNGGTVTSDVSVFKVGAGSALFNAATDRMFRADEAAWPHSSLGSVTAGTIMCWARSTDLSTTNVLFSKGRQTVTDDLVWMLTAQSNGTVNQNIGYNTGTSVETFAGAAGDFVVNTWHHVAFSYDSVSKAWHMRIYNADSTNVVDYTGTGAQTMNSESVAYSWGWLPGNVVPWIGNIDDVQVVTRILSNADIDAVRDGEFGASGMATGSAGMLGCNF